VSWRSGSSLFREMWPLPQARIPDARLRQEFLGRILALFLEWDVDPENLADLHTEVCQALADLGSEVDVDSRGVDDVACCVRQFASAAEKDRVTAAQAIEFDVHQAADPAEAATVALRALVGALRDASLKVRRAAAKSIESLLADKFPLPSQAMKGLEEAASDEDEIVRKRIAKAMKRIETSTKRDTGRTRRFT
jgi:hypothetical protein